VVIPIELDWTVAELRSVELSASGELTDIDMWIELGTWAVPVGIAAELSELDTLADVGDIGGEVLVDFELKIEPVWVRNELPDTKLSDTRTLADNDVWIQPGSCTVLVWTTNGLTELTILELVDPEAWVEMEAIIELVCIVWVTAGLPMELWDTRETIEIWMELEVWIVLNWATLRLMGLAWLGDNVAIELDIWVEDALWDIFIWLFGLASTVAVDNGEVRIDGKYIELLWTIVELKVKPTEACVEAVFSPWPIEITVELPGMALDELDTGGDSAVVVMKLVCEIAELITDVTDTWFKVELWLLIIGVINDVAMPANVEDRAADVEFIAKLLCKVDGFDGDGDDSLIDVGIPIMLVETVAELDKSGEVIADGILRIVLLWGPETDSVDGIRTDVEATWSRLFVERAVFEDCNDMFMAVELGTRTVLIWVPEIDNVDGARAEVELSWGWRLLCRYPELVDTNDALTKVEVGAWGILLCMAWIDRVDGVRRVVGKVWFWMLYTVFVFTGGGNMLIDKVLVDPIAFVLPELCMADDSELDSDIDRGLFIPINVLVVDDWTLGMGIGTELAELAELVAFSIVGFTKSVEENLDAGADAGVFGPITIFVLPWLGNAKEKELDTTTVAEPLGLVILVVVVEPARVGSKRLDVEVVKGLIGPMIIFVEAELISVDGTGPDVDIFWVDVLWTIIELADWCTESTLCWTRLIWLVADAGRARDDELVSTCWEVLAGASGGWLKILNTWGSDDGTEIIEV
jgi:hypothetical protein